MADGKLQRQEAEAAGRNPPALKSRKPEHTRVSVSIVLSTLYCPGTAAQGMVLPTIHRGLLVTD